MLENKKIREYARYSLGRKLFGNTWLMLALCGFIASAIVSIPGLLSSVLSAVSPAVAAIGLPLVLCTIILDGPMSYGLARIYYMLVLGKNEVKVPDLFVGFKENFVDSIKLGFMQKLYIFLWSLLLIIPGIVKSYSYSMAFFIQQESSDKNWRSCLDRSQTLMDGYKGKLFLLDLSFIGWYILGFLCLGIGVLWVNAYHSAARAHFYEELKRIKLGEAEEEDDQVFSSDSDKGDGQVFNYGDEEEEEVFSYTDDDADSIENNEEEDESFMDESKSFEDDSDDDQ